MIRVNFDVIYEDNKLSGSELSSFGYFSVHFHCRLNQGFKGPRYDEIKDILFEIQVRTISMDAWANISHYLDYKTDVEIPKDLKKDFFALSGLFYVADTHFEMFFKNKKEHSKTAKKDVEKKIDIELNFESLEAYLNNRFKTRSEPSSEAISQLTRELNQIGYKMISVLGKKLDEVFKIKPENKYPNNLNKVGVVRIALKEHDADFNRIWEEKKAILQTRNKKK